MCRQDGWGAALVLIHMGEQNLVFECKVQNGKVRARPRDQAARPSQTTHGSSRTRRKLANVGCGWWASECGSGTLGLGARHDAC